MKVLVISGFLGAGKTTFIKNLSMKTAKQFTILENEYGAVGIDADLLKDAGMKNIWEMSSGCICCSKKGDFAASILTIANTLDPEFLIIEPSGVGKLSKVLSHIKKVEYERISILSPLTIVDGESIDKYRREFGEIYDDQILSAGQVIISKLENSASDVVQRAVDSIKDINPDVDIVSNHYLTMGDEWWDDILLKLHDGTKIIEPKDEEDESGFDSLALEDVSISNPSRFVLLLEDIIRGFYGNIIRAKGSLVVGDVGLKFDLADTKYSVLTDDTVSSSNIVFIGKDIDKDRLKKIFIKKKRYKIVRNT